MDLVFGLWNMCTQALGICMLNMARALTMASTKQ